MDEISWTINDGAPPSNSQDISDQFYDNTITELLGGPDWVRAPKDLPHPVAGEKLYIDKKGWADMPCPVQCGGESTYVIKLDISEWEDEICLCVGCCLKCKQYSWFTLPKGDSK